jgi:hypothetical protein
MLVQQLPNLQINLVDLSDSTSLVLSDMSTYITTPASNQLALAITPPGFNTVSVTFTPLNVNVYKCVDLGITCGDSGCCTLPDGIYDITYTVTNTTNITTGQPVTTSIDKKFVKIDRIKCAYQHAFIAIDLECTCHNHSHNAYMKELQRSNLYINGCVAECNRGNYVLSWSYYQKAEFILNNLACKFAGRCNGNGYFEGCSGCR